MIAKEQSGIDGNRCGLEILFPVDTIFYILRAKCHLLLLQGQVPVPVARRAPNTAEAAKTTTDAAANAADPAAREGSRQTREGICPKTLGRDHEPQRVRAAGDGRARCC